MQARLRVLLLALVTAAVFVAVGTAATSSNTGAGGNYIVLYKSAAVPKDAAATIAGAGGTLVYSYDEIGVAIARSDNSSFRDNLLKDNRIENASPTAGFATRSRRARPTTTDGRCRSLARPMTGSSTTSRRNV